MLTSDQVIVQGVSLGHCLYLKHLCYKRHQARQKAITGLLCVPLYTAPQYSKLKMQTHNTHTAEIDIILRGEVDLTLLNSRI